MTTAADCSVDDRLWQRLGQMLASGRLDTDLIESCRQIGGIGIAVLVDGADGPATWDASCEQAFTACESEVLSGGGPATSALREGGVVRAADLSATDRREWMLCTRIAVQLGWRSVVAAPVSWQTGDGAVVVYSSDLSGLDAVGSPG